MDEPIPHRQRPIILLKLTGEVLSKNTDGSYDNTLIVQLAQQIKELSGTHYFGIVIGGGNFFRGSYQGQQLHLSQSVGHQVGMVATVMNGLIIQDLFAQHGVKAALISAQGHTDIAASTSPAALANSMAHHACIIFVGGLGNPFFTTDTTAIVRALQLQATMVWKATSVDGVFDRDPKKDSHAVHLPSLSFEHALAQRLGIMDQTALLLAYEHRLPIRVFNIFKPNALVHAAQDASFGSFITPDVRRF